MEFIPRLWRYLGPIFTWHKDTRNPLSLCNLVSLGIRKEFENYARLPQPLLIMLSPSLQLFICQCCYDLWQQQSWGLANEQQLRFVGEEMLRWRECFWNIERGPGLRYRGLRYASFRKHNEKYCTSITSSQYTPCITQYTLHSLGLWRWFYKGNSVKGLMIISLSYLVFFSIWSQGRSARF